MDPVLHTIIALGSIAVAFFVGRQVGFKTADRENRDFVFALFDRLYEQGKLTDVLDAVNNKGEKDNG